MAVLLRASNEGSLRPHVVRAKESDQAALPVPLEFLPNSLSLPITNHITCITLTH